MAGRGRGRSHKLAPPPAAAIARMCAFRAVFALDSRPCSSQGQALRGNGGYLPCQWVVFRTVLDFRGFYTAWKAGIQRIKRALRAPSWRGEGKADGQRFALSPTGAIARMCAFRALFTLDSGPCSSQGPSSAPHSSHHSPLEGESQQPSRQAPAAAVGGMRPLRFSWAVGCSRRFRCSPHRRDIGLAPSSCRLPLKGGVMHRNSGVGFIRWMPIGFLHRLLFFCHSGESRNPAQKERGTRTYERWRRQAAARV